MRHKRMQDRSVPQVSNLDPQHQAFVRRAPNIGRFQWSGVEAAREQALPAGRCEAIEALQRENLSLNTMATRLNADSVRASRGGKWMATAAKRIIERLESRTHPPRG
jgi:hypothetical protein